MCSKNAQYSANTGNVTISVANPNLNGTGTLGTVIVASQDGTLIKNISIKAIGNTTLGMVRLFVADNLGNAFLLQEVMIPANLQTGVVKTFSTTINNAFILKSGYQLKASTQNAESFNVTVIATNWVNCPC
jgi:hypothetical protein